MKHIVTLGGGSGQYAILEGLRRYSLKNPHDLDQSHITAIVPTSDKGGSTGEIIRERIPKSGESHLLPPGDISRCLLALANNEERRQFYDFRPREGKFKGHTLRNIFLDLAHERFGDFEKALEFLRKDLDVRGQVYPATLERVELCAELENGLHIEGETSVETYRLFNRSWIQRLYLKPKDVKPNEKAVQAVLQADCIVIGPGSLYTSLLACLIVPGIIAAVQKSTAHKLFIINIATQRGETDGFTAKDHLDEIEQYIGKGVLTHVVVNSKSFTPEMHTKYREKWQDPVQNDLSQGKISLIESSYLESDGILRHDVKHIAEEIMRLS